MSINVVYDQEVAQRPAGFTAAIEYVKNLYNAIFTTSAQININVGFGTVNGATQNIGLATSSTLGSSQYNFGQVTGALLAQNPAAAASLPATDPTGGQQIRTSTAQQKVLGLWTGAANFVDGAIGFSSTANFDYGLTGPASANAFDFIGAAEHEISEVMGRGYDGSVYGAGVVNLYTYSSPGVLAVPGTSGSYFSTDHGQTALQYFNNQALNGGDYSDWAPSASNDAFVAAASPGRSLALTGTDLALMKAVGWQTNFIGTGMNVTGNGETDLFTRDGNGNLIATLVNSSGTVTGAVQLGSGPVVVNSGTGSVSVNLDHTTVTVATGGVAAVNGIANVVTLAASATAAVSGLSNSVSGLTNDTITLSGIKNSATAGVGTHMFDVGNADTISIGAGSTLTATGTGLRSVDIGAGSTVTVAGFQNTITATGSITMTDTGAQNKAFVGAGSTGTLGGQDITLTSGGSVTVIEAGLRNTVIVGDNSHLTSGGNHFNASVGTGSTITITGTLDIVTALGYATVNVGGSSNVVVVGGNALVASTGDHNLIKTGDTSAVVLAGTANAGTIGANSYLTFSSGVGNQGTVTGSGAYIYGNGGTVSINSNLSTTVFADRMIVNADSNDVVGVYGIGNITNVSGTGTGIWVGANGQYASDANDDRVTLAQGGAVFVSANSRVDIFGNGANVQAGSSDTVGVYGSGAVVNVSGTGTGVWIGGNGQYASATNNDVVTLAQGGAVFVSDSSPVDIIGNATTVFAGSSSTVGVYGNGDTANVTGTGTGVWIGGTSDTVNLTQGGAVFVANNSQVNINGNATSVLAGTSDIIGLNGTGNQVFFTGGTTGLWLSGGAEVTLGAAGEYIHTTVAQLANDTVSGLVAGNGIDISDLIPGSASFSFTANATGGVLHLADATHSTQFQLNGSYSPGSFHLAADGYGGTFLSYG